MIKKIVWGFLMVILMLSTMGCSSYSGESDAVKLDELTFYIPASEWKSEGDVSLEDWGNEIEADDYMEEFQLATLKSEEYGSIIITLREDFSDTDFRAEWEKNATYDTVEETKAFEISGKECVYQKYVGEHVRDSYEIFVNLTEELGRMYNISVEVPFEAENENAGEEILSCIKSKGIEVGSVDESGTNKCNFEGCENVTAHGYNYCKEHLCEVNGCAEGRVNDFVLCPEHFLCSYEDAEGVPDFGYISGHSENEDMSKSLLDGYTGSDKVIAFHVYELGESWFDDNNLYTDLLEARGYALEDIDTSKESVTHTTFSNDKYTVGISEIDNNTDWYEKDYVITILEK